jgi:hypothetical protein
MMIKTLLSLLLVLLLSACSQNDNGNSSSSDGTAKVTTTPSDASARTIVTGPYTGIKITEAYATQVAKENHFRIWPIVSMYNFRMTLAGPLMMVPLNRLPMLTDDVIPKECAVTCPNKAIVYGIGCPALDQSPLLMRVPDLSHRFRPYQTVDQRTDGFAQPDKMHDAKPGFYLLADLTATVMIRKPSLKYSGSLLTPQRGVLFSY